MCNATDTMGLPFPDILSINEEIKPKHLEQFELLMKEFGNFDELMKGFKTFYVSQMSDMIYPDQTTELFNSFVAGYVYGKRIERSKQNEKLG